MPSFTIQVSKINDERLNTDESCCTYFGDTPNVISVTAQGDGAYKIEIEEWVDPLDFIWKLMQDGRLEADVATPRSFWSISPSPSPLSPERVISGEESPVRSPYAFFQPSSLLSTMDEERMAIQWTIPPGFDFQVEECLNVLMRVILSKISPSELSSRKFDTTGCSLVIKASQEKRTLLYIALEQFVKDIASNMRMNLLPRMTPLVAPALFCRRKYFAHHPMDRLFFTPEMCGEEARLHQYDEIDAILRNDFTEANGCFVTCTVFRDQIDTIDKSNFFWIVGVPVGCDVRASRLALSTLPGVVGEYVDMDFNDLFQCFETDVWQKAIDTIREALLQTSDGMFTREMRRQQFALWANFMQKLSFDFTSVSKSNLSFRNRQEIVKKIQYVHAAHVYRCLSDELQTDVPIATLQTMFALFTDCLPPIIREEEETVWAARDFDQKLEWLKARVRNTLRLNDAQYRSFCRQVDVLRDQAVSAGWGVVTLTPINESSDVVNPSALVQKSCVSDSLEVSFLPSLGDSSSGLLSVETGNDLFYKRRYIAYFPPPKDFFPLDRYDKAERLRRYHETDAKLRQQFTRERGFFVSCTAPDDQIDSIDESNFFWVVGVPADFDVTTSRFVFCDFPGVVGAYINLDSDELLERFEEELWHNAFQLLRAELPRTEHGLLTQEIRTSLSALWDDFVCKLSFTFLPEVYLPFCNRDEVKKKVQYVHARQVYHFLSGYDVSTLSLLELHILFTLCTDALPPHIRDEAIETWKQRTFDQKLEWLAARVSHQLGLDAAQSDEFNQKIAAFRQQVHPDEASIVPHCVAPQPPYHQRSSHFNFVCSLDSIPEELSNTEELSDDDLGDDPDAGIRARGP